MMLSLVTLQALEHGAGVTRIDLVGPVQQAATINLGWLVDLAAPYVESLLVALLSALVGWITMRLGRLLGVQADATRAKALHQAIERAVAHGINQAATRIKKETTLDVESEIIARAAAYLELHMADTLAHFGLTDDALDSLIESHMGSWAASAVTPPKEAPAPSSDLERGDA